MKVFLINPPFKVEYGKFSRDQRSPAITKSGTVYYPTWLASATGVLEEAGYECRLLDSCVKQMNDETTLAIIKDFAPDMIVIDTSTPSIYNDCKFAEKVKEVLPECFTVLVGTHPSALPEETMELNTSVDAVARKEYEYTLRELAHYVKIGNMDFRQILGLTYRTADGKIISNPDRPYIEDLDALLSVLHDDKKRIIALQPISQKESATKLCIETCIARNWRLSMQTHKYLNIA